ncbi:hypothetical protein RGUI_0427 [Rhodovulum sp. P5]|uniref:DUF5333 domain-containing protein n=1 Tax=Rhodovulum sp. P5 TaxID=1564506 RepID=UPI0009C38DEC|nr:DUF5333 domain-containing protein [Rhodovulum sp. P5]ARE38568.1 hypothetical protein RGUI_0427 [Rhodovulum sp. P5]
MIWGGRHTAAAVAAALFTAAGVPASGAQELPPLRENARIYDTLFAASLGDEIQKNCPTISARMFFVWQQAKKLENYARSLGYSEDEVKAFLKSKEERALMRARRDAYLADHGVVEGDAQSYCRLGREEMKNGTFTGSLLRGR